MPGIRFDILSLFPDVFDAFLNTSIMRIAAEKKLAEYHLHDIRDYSDDRHRKVDARPYGGGPGMVLRCEPVVKAFDAVQAMDDKNARSLLLTPQGKTLQQKVVENLACEDRILLICGHYEGFDERIRQNLPVEEVSIGDYVLSGGETAAMVLVDAVVRLIPGVLGHQDSPREESFSDGVLEYPQYTRPPEFRGLRVPDVLLSGNHEKIKSWRAEQARKRTDERRSDLCNGNTQDSE